MRFAVALAAVLVCAPALAARQAAQRRARRDRRTKRKGPGMKRDLSLWAQVGEGRLAIGCMAAAPAGQVEFGIPCVLGGVATSATLRPWDRPN